MGKSFYQTYHDLWQRKKPNHDNYVFSYHGKKGYRDWVADPKHWATHGLQEDCYEVERYIDLNEHPFVPCKAREIIEDVEPCTEYIVMLKAGDMTLASVRQTSSQDKYFCDPAVIAYIPVTFSFPKEETWQM